MNIQGSQGRGGGAQPEKCAICLTDLSEVDAKDVRVTFCDHCFCRACLAEWSKKSDTCPICRDNLCSDAWIVIIIKPPLSTVLKRMEPIANKARQIVSKAKRIAGKVILNCSAPIAFAALIAYCYATKSETAMTANGCDF